MAAGGQERARCILIRMETTSGHSRIFELTRWDNEVTSADGGWRALFAFVAQSLRVSLHHAHDRHRGQSCCGMEDGSGRPWDSVHLAVYRPVDKWSQA